jgi:riboflavin biosynthesis pyrimidine reductase
MRQVLPLPLDDVDPLALYGADVRTAPPGRPWVLTNMITSVDGATEVGGTSGSLGMASDKAVFSALRSVADVVLVAAGTVRAERYGPVRFDGPALAARAARGQTPRPRMAVVTASLDLDLTAPLFTRSLERPVILTVEEAPADRRAAAEEVAEVVLLGDESVDLRAALAWLHLAAGAEVVLCEGGPSLIGGLAALDVVDEVCWTISNTLVVGHAARLATGPPLQPVSTLHLDRILEAESALFLRYRRDRT